MASTLQSAFFGAFDWLNAGRLHMATTMRGKKNKQRFGGRFEGPEQWSVMIVFPWATTAAD
jgi:hypothetical protein